jgi:NAD(P)H-dependent FMN reductase
MITAQVTPVEVNMNIIISCSLNPNSNSHQMAKRAQSMATGPCEFIDLKEVTLPLCNGVGPTPKAVQDLIDKISQAQSIILAAPVYNYNLNAAAKNLIEWTGKAWNNKVVGFILAAGGKNSYLRL